MPDKFSATIGNFDGIHRGHMKLISHVLSYAEKNNTKRKKYLFFQQCLNAAKMSQFKTLGD